ncbi:unknown [Clostridium sp. CAG:921]|nr:unknown [Clostridium sp. CAG:921]
MDDTNNLNKKSAAPAASLTLGIISIVTALFWYLALPSGILAIVFGANSVKKFGSKLGKAGIITGIIGLSLFLFIYISILLLILLSNYM